MQEIKRFRDGTCFTCRPADNGVFYIFWSEQRRSRRESTGTKEMAAADAYLDEWLRLRSAPRTASFTCADLWSAKYDSANDRAGYAWGNLRRTFGEKRPAEVTQATVDRYIFERKARPSTIRYEIACLYASWNAAVKARMLTAADLPALAPPPAGSPPRERWLTSEEIDKLLAAARGVPHVELFIWIALDTAARRAAICELTWDQVDFEAGVIHFNPEGRAQTRKRRASVPISKRLRPILERAWLERKNPYVLGSTGSACRINAALRPVVARSEVPGVTPHVLRHTAATHMARRGVPLWIIAKVLGNTIEQVEKTYAKFAPDFAREAVEQIGGEWGRPRIVHERPKGAPDTTYSDRH